MKRIIELLLIIIFTLSFDGDDCQNLKEPDTEMIQELILNTDINFYNSLYSADIYVDNHFYSFTDRYESFADSIIEILSKSKVAPCDEYKNTEKEIYVVFDCKEYQSISFSINEYDELNISLNPGDYSAYKSKGIYNKVASFLDEHLEHSRKYYVNVDLEDKFLNEYRIYDKNGNILQSETTSRQAQISVSDNDIICKWIQAGTGTLTRTCQFFDWNSGIISPVFAGQTDHYGKLVSATSHGEVQIHDMFSGEIVYTICSFEKPLADCIENISSAYFTDDGQQLEIWYLDEDFNTCKQVFDLSE